MKQQNLIFKYSIAVLTIFGIAAASAAVANVDYNNKNIKQTIARQQHVGSSSSSSVSDKDTHTLHNELEVEADGNYHYAYETSNGISAKEHGQGGIAVEGSSSYISPEGVEIKISYIADETGYHPVGEHIPKTPDYILRALEYIRTHPYQVKDYYSGETKLVSRDSEAFKTVTRNTLPPVKATTATSTYRSQQQQQPQRQTTAKYQQQKQQSVTTESNSNRVHQRRSRGSVKYFNPLY